LLHFLHAAYRDALWIVVSRSGESVEVAKLLALRTPGQKVVGVTNEPASLLAREADVTLLVASLADEMVAIQSYTGTLATLHILSGAVQNCLAACATDFAARVPQFAEVIDSCLENPQIWDDFLDAQCPVHLLARGPSMASALEGALLFNETAKHPAVGMAMASFRHGPVEVVDGNYRGFVFAPEAPTRGLNLGLAQDLKEFGGAVTVIGPVTGEAADLRWAAIPSSPEAVAPLFEIIPIQVAALRMAQLRGIRPGSFRYAPQVTTDEARFSRR
jgi:glucosamine--fructose-6-phosphate aminotransferase (isomerizing)